MKIVINRNYLKIYLYYLIDEHISVFTSDIWDNIFYIDPNFDDIINSIINNQET